MSWATNRTRDPSSRTSTSILPTLSEPTSGTTPPASGASFPVPIPIPIPVPSSPSYRPHESSFRSSFGSVGASFRGAYVYDAAPASRQHLPTSPLQPDWPSPFLSPVRRSPKSQHRRSSLSLSPSGGADAGTPFGSLVGSYENSLLAGRLSALPSLPVPFMASIGVLGSADAPPKLKCPPHLAVSFGAFFYTGPEGTPSSSPYVGTIDLEAHYYSSLSAHGTTAAPSTSTIPRFPGYRIPEKGQLQLVIKNSNSTAVKVFLVPYDLKGLSRSGMGGKTFLRQKSYSVEEALPSPSRNPNEPKRRLRYALHLQLCSPPMTRKDSTPSYYLHQTIRVVFASSARGGSLSENLQVVAETPGDSTAWTDEQFSPYQGPSVDWEMARKKAKAREKVAFAEPPAPADEQDSEPSSPYFLHHGPLLSTPPPSSPPSMSRLSLSNTLPKHTKRSGLSSSRPPSPPSPPPIAVRSQSQGGR